VDLRTGRTYESYEAAREAGVPASDIAEVLISKLQDDPVVRFSTGPFKDREYKRTPTGGLVRVK